MPETSIVQSSDSFVNAMKKMRDASQLFTKDLDGLQKRLDTLNKTKASLKVDTDKAKQSLMAAEKQFASTGDVIDELILQGKQLTFEEARRNLSLVTKEAANVEKQMMKTGDAFDSAGNSSGIGTTSTDALKKGLNASGIFRDLSNSVSGLLNTGLTSQFGQQTASAISGIASGALNGAADGAIFGPTGALIGGGIGVVSGAISSVTKIVEAKEDAFKDYYKSLYETVSSNTENTITGGSLVSRDREQTQAVLAQRLGGDEAAGKYLESVKSLASSSNYTFNQLTGYSKTLLNSFGADGAIGALQKLSGAMEGLNLDESGFQTLLSNLSRMQSSERVTQEDLNFLSGSGADVNQVLDKIAQARKAAGMETNVGDGFSGSEAAQAVLDYMEQSFGGLSEKLASTYDALVSNVEDAKTAISAAGGASYNETRKEGLQAEQAAYGGELGNALEKLNAVIGENKAISENLSEQFQREALSALVLGDKTTVFQPEDAEKLEGLREQFQEASEVYENGSQEAGLKMEALKEEAEALATAAYESSGWYQTMQDTELDQIEAIRENTKKLEAVTNAYTMSNAFTRGTGFEIVEHLTPEEAKKDAQRLETLKELGLYAYGLDYVPYDNFPALLHQGERVQTAVEARSERTMPAITITGNSFTVREEADISRVASELLAQMELAGMRG